MPPTFSAGTWQTIFLFFKHWWRLIIPSAYLVDALWIRGKKYKAINNIYIYIYIYIYIWQVVFKKYQDRNCIYQNRNKQRINVLENNLLVFQNACFTAFFTGQRSFKLFFWYCVKSCVMFFSFNTLWMKCFWWKRGLCKYSFLCTHQTLHSETFYCLLNWKFREH